MKNFKNRNVFSVIAILMVMTFAISMIVLPSNVAAQSTREIVTFPFVDAIPRTAGVGQYVLINFGLLNYLAIDGDGWNVTLRITDPNGRTSTVDRMTWSTGTVGYGFVPDTLGTYKLQCTFDRVYYDASSAAVLVGRVPTGWYLASESEVIDLVITETPKPDYSGHGMPSEYWTRPIDPQIREWWSIAGSWVATPMNLYAPYNDAPESAHILWSMPIGDTLGGLTGGDNWEIGYQNGDAYEGKFAGSIIIGGILYYNRGGTYNQASVANANSGAMGVVNGSVPHQRNTIVAVDLHTGKILWEKSYNFNTTNDARVTHGQILTWICLNNRGTFAHIWLGNAGTMYAIEPMTGELIYTMVNVPAGTIYYGPNGEMLKYQIVNYGTADNPSYHLLQWNSSWVVTQGKIGMMESWGSQVQGVTYDAAARGYDLNISIPAQTGTIMTAFPEDRIIVSSVTADNVILSAISLRPGDKGRMLYQNVRWAAPAVWQELTIGAQGGWVAYSQESYVAVYWTKENRIHYGFSLETGQYLWQTEQQSYADAWSDSSSIDNQIAYDKLFSASLGGIVYCYDVKTGQKLWTYAATDKFSESYLTENWWLVPVFISSEKLYVGHMEHSALEPKPRGAPFIALDVYTGEVVWEIDGAFRQTRWGGRAIIGDSIIATMDTFDQQIYAIGKGPSVMTVTAPNFAVAVKTPVLIQGTIMDNSPGTQNDKIQLRFPNGVPAVSDASMSDWMMYVYKQFERPHDVTGVPITVCVIDPNGNDSYLNTVSNANGNFVVEFKPETEGTYEIYAYFDGSASYFGSSVEGKLLVSATGSTVAGSTPAYEWYIIGMGIAIMAVVAIFGLLILKKK